MCEIDKQPINFDNAIKTLEQKLGVTNSVAVPVSTTNVVVGSAKSQVSSELSEEQTVVTTHTTSTASSLPRVHQVKNPVYDTSSSTLSSVSNETYSGDSYSNASIAAQCGDTAPSIPLRVFHLRKERIHQLDNNQGCARATIKNEEQVEFNNLVGMASFEIITDTATQQSIMQRVIGHFFGWITFYINGYNEWKDSMGGVISSDDIARSVLFSYQQPQNVCIREMLITATR